MTKFIERTLQVFRVISDRINKGNAEGLMDIGKLFSGIGVLIDLLLFLIIQKNFDASYSGVSLIVGYVGLMCFAVGLVVFFIGVELRNKHSR